jgi:hypothetical protein
MATKREIMRMTRRELRDFLESWGYAVYSDESIKDLRETALEHANQDLWSEQYRGVPGASR